MIITPRVSRASRKRGLPGLSISRALALPSRPLRSASLKPFMTMPWFLDYQASGRIFEAEAPLSPVGLEGALPRKIPAIFLPVLMGSSFLSYDRFSPADHFLSDCNGFFVFLLAHRLG